MASAGCLSVILGGSLACATACLHYVFPSSTEVARSRPVHHPAHCPRCRCPCAADQLRLAVAEALCRTAARRNEFAPAVYAVEAEDKMQKWVGDSAGGVSRLRSPVEAVRMGSGTIRPSHHRGEGGGRCSAAACKAPGQLTVCQPRRKRPAARPSSGAAATAPSHHQPLALCARRSRLAAHGAPCLHPPPPPRSYCRRILSPTFWGGEPELLVLSQMLRVPILVYIPAKEAGSRWGRFGWTACRPPALLGGDAARAARMLRYCTARAVPGA